MGRVLEFRQKEETKEQLRGPARCLGCGHTWEAVSPVGVYTDLECQNCSTDKGIREGLMAPGTRFVCNCGNDVYYILPDGCLCIQCGVLAKGF